MSLEGCLQCYSLKHRGTDQAAIFDLLGVSTGWTSSRFWSKVTAQSVPASDSGIKTKLLSSAALHVMMYSTVLIAAWLEAVKIGEHSLSLCWQLEGHQSNKSSSFQVTSRSENVYMMAVLMGQSS